MKVTLELTEMQVHELQTSIELRRVELTERKLTGLLDAGTTEMFRGLLQDIREQIQEQAYDSDASKYMEPAY